MSFDYNGKKWKRKRKAILKRDKYICQELKRYGKAVEADRVHHIYPADEYPEYAWCNWNLTSVSKKGHNKYHDRKTNKLTARGQELKRKTIPPT